MRGGYRFAPGKRVKAKNEGLGSDSIRTDRALVPGAARMAAPGANDGWFHFMAHGTAASGALWIFRECRHKYISWLRAVLDFAATNDDK
jgi:hypothetical protein